MKQSSPRFRLQRSAPIPSLLAGYIAGLLFSLFLVLSHQSTPPFLLRPAPLRTAFRDFAFTELPFWIACTVAGFCRFSGFASIPVWIRGFLFGYASLPIYLYADRELTYFFFVTGSALALLPLCCVAKLAQRQSCYCGPQNGKDHLRYLFRCLYYWGLTLIILFIRSSLGTLLR